MKKSLMLMFAAALAGATFAQQPPEHRGFRGRPGPMGGMPMDPIVHMVTSPRMVEKLGLSEEQSAKLKEVNKGGQEAAGETQKKIRAAMEKQAELLKAKEIDEAAVMASVDEVFDLRKAAAKEQMKKIIAVRAILTPEQIEKAREAMKQMRGRRPEGQGYRGRPRPEGQDNPPPPPPPPAK